MAETKMKPEQIFTNATNFAWGYFTRALDAGSGDVAVTGVGFQPDIVEIEGNVQSDVGRCIGGISNETLNRTMQIADANTTTFRLNVCTYLGDGSGNVSGTIDMDTDGFTLTLTESGTPGSATTYYLWKAWKFAN